MGEHNTGEPIDELIGELKEDDARELEGEDIGETTGNRTVGMSGDVVILSCNRFSFFVNLL